MGLFLVGQKPVSARKETIEISWVVFVKLIIHPLVTWWMATYLLVMEPIYVASAVIMASLPTGGLTFLVAEKYGVYVRRSAAIILVTTVVSVITVSFVVAQYVDDVAL
jgi:predicted permease